VTTSPRIDTALFALGFVLAGLVLLALLWSGAGPYEDMARANGVSATLMIFRGSTGTVETPVDLPHLVEWHQSWSRYVTGGTNEAPTWFGGEVFTRDEYSHMADVRRVFEGATLLVPAGLFLMAFRLQRARMRSVDAMLLVAHDGARVALVLVVIVGVVAAFAFDPLFLLFHYVFFPQGNFLFDPRTSNLVRLYPDWYWEGITLRIGLSFVALAAAVFAVSAAGLRRVRASRLASE
jgi:integral membrane protein (TIGR01906 family)